MGEKGDATRERILRIIHRAPGASKSILSRDAGLAWGTISYHLRVLQNEGQVDLFRRGRTVHVVPREFASDLQRNSAVMAPLARDILLAIAHAGARGPAALSRATGATARRVQGQLAYLVQAGLLDSDGSYHVRYELTQDGRAAAKNIHAQQVACPHMRGL